MLKARSCARLVLVTGVGISIWRSCAPHGAFCGMHKVVADPCGSVWEKPHRSQHPLAAFPDGADLLQYLLAMPEDFAGSWHRVADATASAGSWLDAQAALPNLDLRLVPPAFADAGVATMPELDPNIKYLYGANGEVLLEPSTLKPLQDDWWNAAVGAQAGIVRGIDGALRYIGVPQAFGWTILVWTCIFKLLLYPFEQGSLQMTAKMKMLQPKVNEMKERFKDDPDELSRRTVKLYEIFKISPLSTLGSLAQLPLIFTLFYCWRRLAAERFEHFSEPWLWIPSLSQPNPGFNLTLDWLLQFGKSGPLIGWDIWIRQLILPGILIGYYSYKALDGIKESENPNYFLTFLPVALIGFISLEFPQIMALYYLAFNFIGVVAVEISKAQVRSEMPVFEVYEKTGQFPEGNFEEVFFATLHQASATGNAERVQELIASGVDVNARDEEGAPAIFNAVAAGHDGIVTLLTIAGADIMARDSKGNTLMHVAAFYDRLYILTYLVAMGQQLEKSDFPDNEKWVYLKNDGDLTVLDCAKVAPGQSVLQYISAELGLNLRDPKEQLEEVTSATTTTTTTTARTTTTTTSTSASSTTAAATSTLHSAAANVPAEPARARRLD